MPVAVLTTDPAAPTLEPAAVAALRDAWGGGEVVWHAPDLAAEFALDRVPDNAGDVRAAFRARGVDLNLVPDTGRRKRLLLADMDSTMIGQECVDELAAVAGVGDRVRGITARAMNGELAFEEALAARVALLEGQPEEVVARVLAERIGYTAGGAELVATMRAHGAHAALVSGGFTAFTAAVAGRLGFDSHRANTLEIAAGRLTGRVVPPILGREAKVAALHDLTDRLGIGPEAVLAVGDGANDLGMLGLAGMGVALHAKPVVAEACALRVDHGDLTALLYLQGYTAEEIVRPA